MFFKFKNTKLGGFHVETVNGETVTYLPADDPIIESSSDLAKNYPDKFIEAEAPKGGSKKKTVIVDADESELGQDVTAKYKAAQKTGFLVFQDGDGGLHVATEDEPDFALNADALSGRQISTFVKKQLA